MAVSLFALSSHSRLGPSETQNVTQHAPDQVRTILPTQDCYVHQMVLLLEPLPSSNPRSVPCHHLSLRLVGCYLARRTVTKQVLHVPFAFLQLPAKTAISICRSSHLTALRQ